MVSIICGMVGLGVQYLLEFFSNIGNAGLQPSNCYEQNVLYIIYMEGLRWTIDIERNDLLESSLVYWNLVRIFDRFYQITEIKKKKSLLNLSNRLICQTI